MSIHTPTAPVQDRPKRIVAIDIVRGIALIAMASYHFTWDLEFFGYTDPGLTAFGWWKIYARCIASTFLFLVGVSLFLAHGEIRWNGFGGCHGLRRRLGRRPASPRLTFIFFGILHKRTGQPARPASCLPALLARRWPHHRRAVYRASRPSTIRGWVCCRRAIRVPTTTFRCFVRAVLQHRGDAPPPLRLLPGLPNWHPVAGPTHGLHRPAQLGLLPDPPAAAIGSVWLFAQVMPAKVETPQVNFLKTCQLSCEQSRDTEFCSSYCVCMLDTLEGEATLDRLYNNDQTAEWKAHISDLAGMCTAKTDSKMMEEGVK